MLEAQSQESELKNAMPTAKTYLDSLQRSCSPKTSTVSSPASTVVGPSVLASSSPKAAHSEQKEVTLTKLSSPALSTTQTQVVDDQILNIDNEESLEEDVP